MDSQKDIKKNQSRMALLKKMHDLFADPDIKNQRQAQENLAMLTKVPKDVIVSEVSFDGFTGEWLIPSRVHTKKKVILYCHGGGFSTGSTAYARSITLKLAQETGLDVFAFNYRLAPEHPYPAALEDGLLAWNYLMHLGYGAQDVVIAGDSAGGNLALTLSLSLKQDGRFLPGGLLLFSPWTDMTMSGKSHQTKESIDPILSPAYVRSMIANYAPGEDLTNPLISPLFGDYTDFPPVYIQVGTNEILYHDASLLYRKLLAKGVSAKMDTYNGMWHVFQMSPLKQASRAMKQAAEFICKIFE